MQENTLPPFCLHLLCSILISVTPSIAYANTELDELNLLSLEDLLNITVTAEKQVSTLQEVDISMTTFSNKQLNTSYIQDIQALSSYTPNMTFNRIGGQAQIYLRGIGSDAIGAGSDASTTVHQDGIYLGRPEMALAHFLDVERIEVLRGPQGTLYGRNSVGGTINIISAGPTPDWDGYANLSVGNFNHREFSGAIGGPLSDKSGIRLALKKILNSGFTQDLDPRGGDKIDDTNSLNVRAILETEFRQDTQFKLIADWYHLRDHGRSIRSVDDLSLAHDRAAERVSDFHDVRNNLDTFNDNETGGVAAQVDFNFDNFQLTSITGFRMLNASSSFNTDGTEIDITETQFERKQEQISQEIRLVYDDAAHWNWLVGVYLLHEDSDMALGLPRIPLDTSFILDSHHKTDAWAVFINTNYQLSEKLELEAGLRYSKEKKSDQRFIGLVADTTGLNSLLAISTLASTSGDNDYQALTPKLGLAYQIEDNRRAYITISRGFKSGGTNSLSTSKAFDPEYILSVEAGYKVILTSKNLRINSALFYSSYDNLQVLSFEQGLASISNAAEATIWGGEVEALFQQNRNLEWSLALGALYAKYDHFISSQAGNPVDVSGNTLQSAPKLQLNASSQYQFPFESGSKIYFRGELHSQSEVYFDQFNDDAVKQDGFLLANFMANYSSGAKPYQLSFHIKNIFNKEYNQNIVRFTTTSSNPVGNALASPAIGRNFSLKLTYHL